MGIKHIKGYTTDSCKKRNSIKNPFLNLLLDYVPVKEEALSSLYEINILIKSDIAKYLRNEIRNKY